MRSLWEITQQNINPKRRNRGTIRFITIDKDRRSSSSKKIQEIIAEEIFNINNDTY